MGKLSDLTLIARVVATGNQRAFEELVKIYQEPVRRYLMNLTCGNEPLADDLAQETFIKAYYNIKQYKSLANFKSWVIRIAYHHFIDYLRRNNQHFEEVEKADQYYRSHIETTSTDSDVYLAMRELKEIERNCITLQYIEGYKLSEISKILDCPVNTIKSHSKRAKDKMKTFLLQNGYG